MGYKNCNAYVQRHIDNILRHTKGLAYTDDIFTGSRTFVQHLTNLKAVFGALLAHNISIGPKKTFIAFTLVVVLGRIIDSLGLSTIEDKMAAIHKLVFPTTLKQLESLLSFAGSLRHNVPQYARIVKPLQNLKTALVR
ncbi:hypothetical protein MY11210_003468 [Beauveria gryllotalpidicola]